MFCKHCGGEVNDGAVICVKCGCSLTDNNFAFKKSTAPKLGTLNIIQVILLFLTIISFSFIPALEYIRFDGFTFEMTLLESSLENSLMLLIIIISFIYKTILTFVPFKGALRYDRFAVKSTSIVFSALNFTIVLIIGVQLYDFFELLAGYLITALLTIVNLALAIVYAAITKKQP